MNITCKCLSLLFIAMFASSSLIINQATSTSANSSTPEFTLKFVDKSYDVAPTTTSSTGVRYDYFSYKNIHCKTR